MAHARHGRSRPGFVGFSLVGILVVMAIILFLQFGPTGPGGTSAVQQAQRSRQYAETVVNQVNVQQLGILIAQHEMMNGSYPTTLEEMGMEHHPAFRDAHGTMIRFRLLPSEGQGQTATIEITSAGEDTEFDTPDDEVTTGPMPL
ncbi:MAG: type II secretion system protein [Planctomycetota bacterium]